MSLRASQFNFLNCFYSTFISASSFKFYPEISTTSSSKVKIDLGTNDIGVSSVTFLSF